MKSKKWIFRLGDHHRPCLKEQFWRNGKEQVEMFINAIEESAKNRPVHMPVAAREIKGESELREMMRLRKMKIKEKENAGK